MPLLSERLPELPAATSDGLRIHARGRSLSRVEQLAARRAHNPEVAGSSPAPANSEFYTTAIGTKPSGSVPKAPSPAMRASASTSANLNDGASTFTATIHADLELIAWPYTTAVAAVLCDALERA